jgi:hypothetical protein
VILSGAADKPFKETGSVKRNLYTHRKRALKRVNEGSKCGFDHELGPFGSCSVCLRNKAN